MEKGELLLPPQNIPSLRRIAMSTGLCIASGVAGGVTDDFRSAVAIGWASAAFAMAALRTEARAPRPQALYQRLATAVITSWNSRGAT